MASKVMIEQIEKERKKQLTADEKALLTKDWVKNNQTFLPEQILEFHDLFVLYADYRTKRVDLKDILQTASTLGLNNKYSLVFRILKEIQELNEKQAQEEGKFTDLFDFETFVLLLTEKLGNTFTQEGRFAIYNIINKNEQKPITKIELQETADELRYNLGENEAEEIVQNVAGFGAQEFDFDKFDKFIQRKIDRRKEKII